jgi:hypothetical protein
VHTTSTFSWDISRAVSRSGIVPITLDRYGQLVPGNEAEARARLDAYLQQEGG